MLHHQTSHHGFNRRENSINMRVPVADETCRTPSNSMKPLQSSLPSDVSSDCVVLAWSMRHAAISQCCCKAEPATGSMISADRPPPRININC